MCKTPKAVLSRKGIDGGNAGGRYSPFDPETGAYIVLPIPRTEKEHGISNNLKYKDVRIHRGYLPNSEAENLDELMQDLKITPRDKDRRSEYAHVDPWLGPCPWLTEDSNHHIGALGQVDSSQSHLHDQGVGEGSLFLFFSRFEALRNRKNVIAPSFDKQQLSRGLYFMYGWLKVGKVVQQYEDIHDSQVLSRHPHAHTLYFQEYARKVKGKNTIYTGDRFPVKDGSAIQGCGYFPRLSRSLLLTATPWYQKEHDWLPARWRLPSFFNGTRPTYLKAKPWSVCDDGSVLVHARGRWQEAVFRWSQEFHHWFLRLLTQSLDNG